MVSITIIMGVGESEILQSNLLTSAALCDFWNSRIYWREELPSHEIKKRKWRKVKERDKEVKESEKSKSETKTRRKGEYVRWMTKP